MARPLKIDGVMGVREMSDAELDDLTYYLRVAYAAQLDTNGKGYIYIGTGGSSVGSSVDTSSTQQTNTRTRNYSDGTDYPAYPGIGTETDTTYNYRQDRASLPAFPTNATLDSSGFVIIDGTAGVRTVNTEAQIYAEVITQCIAEMRTGDEVGTYRVATASPGTGWVDKGTWHQDTTYSEGTVTTNLWLKTSGTAPTIVRPLRIDGTNGLIEATGTFDQNHALIQDVLLPCLTRRLDDDDLNYTISDTGIDRGTYTNTRQTSALSSQWFSDPLYFRRSTPTGTATTQNTYTLRLS